MRFPLSRFLKVESVLLPEMHEHRDEEPIQAAAQSKWQWIVERLFSLLAAAADEFPEFAEMLQDFEEGFLDREEYVDAWRTWSAARFEHSLYHGFSRLPDNLTPFGLVEGIVRPTMTEECHFAPPVCSDCGMVRLRATAENGGPGEPFHATCLACGGSRLERELDAPGTKPPWHALDELNMWPHWRALSALRTESQPMETDQ